MPHTYSVVNVLMDGPPRGGEAIERFLLEELPAMGPPPRGREGLDRARRFLAAAGSPQHAAPQVHIVGTAGKGTAAAAIIGRLVGAGAHVASHMSPHVYDLRERFMLDGQLPAWARVEDALHELWPALVHMQDEDGRPPSFFELTTALAWTIGRAAGVDHLVTEAGIGGAFDTTNAIDQPDKITVVMPIGYDHMGILGHDLHSIATDKADVIPHGGLVVMAAQPHPAAAQVVIDTCQARGAELVEVPTPGWRAQADAIATTVSQRLGLAAAPAADVHLPGRMERLDLGQRTVLLDGAHNPMKLRALQSALPTQPSVALAALSREKDLEACAREITRLADVVVASDFVITAGERVVRGSWSAVELATAIKAADPATEVHVVPDLVRATAAAWELTPDDESLLATGSFMMLEPVRDAVRTLH